MTQAVLTRDVPDPQGRPGDDLVVVGGGPRAVAVVARLAARLRPGARYGDPSPSAAALRVAVVDAVEVGAGATWWTGQHRLLLNNTYSAHTTVHADESTDQPGPLVAGPDLVAWARGVREAGEEDAALRPALPPRPGWVAEEVAALRPESYPSRRLQGVYYREQLAEAARRGGIEVRHVLGRATDVVADGERRTVVLDDARVVAVDGPGGHRRLATAEPVAALSAPLVVLAQGMVQARRSPATRAFADAAARTGLVYIEPGMPSERDWDAVPGEGAEVIVAGLGASFFDVVGILTAGRGGRFADARTGAQVDAAGVSTQDGGAGGPAAGAQLVYLPSGREPRLLVGSRRGLPYRGKGAYPPETGGMPPRWVPRLATPQALERAAGRSVTDFRRQIWPLLARELAAAHLLTVLAHDPRALREGLTEGEVLRLLQEAEDPAEVVGSLVADPAADLDVDRLDRPAEVGSPQQWAQWVRRWLDAEQASIADPLSSPRNAVNRAMNTLRRQVARLVRGGLVDGRVVMEEIETWFVAEGLALASGPPPRRTAQLLALVRAGVVELLGEGLRVEADEQGFLARSRVFPEGRRARALIETRMSKGKVPDTDDPLLRALLDSGRARLHTLPSRGRPGAEVPTTSLDVTADGFALIAADGSADPRVLVLGIPAEAVQPGSAIGATPGVPSPLLAGADRAAARALGTDGALPAPSVAAAVR